MKKHAEKNRELLENLMEKHTGSRRTMKLVMLGETEIEGDRSIEDVARDAGDLLGIDVEIQ